MVINGLRPFLGGAHAGLCVLISTSAITTAQAADPAITAEINALKSRIEKLEAQLVEAQGAERRDHSDNTPSPESATVTLNPLPAFESADGRTTLKMDARLTTDIGFVTRDGDADLADATDIRYLRVGAKGQIIPDWSYRLQLEAGNNELEIEDAYIRYMGVDTLWFTLGQHREFTSLERLSSNVDNTFVERSSVVTGLGAGERKIGASLQYYPGSWGVQAGLFGEAAGNEGEDDEGYALSARAYGTPWKAGRDTLHLGGWMRYRVPEAGSDVRLRSRGESRVISEWLVDTGAIANVDHSLTVGLEVRYQQGPVALMAEWIDMRVEREQAADASFEGGYVSASWFLTGEQRSYKAEQGVYGGIAAEAPLSEGGSGAWELAARFSHLDYNDAGAGITGGMLRATTLGLNWYPEDWLRFMLNYVHNNLDQQARYPDADPHYIMLRSQLYF